MIVGYSGAIPAEYDEVFLRLFEQIHARNVAKVDEIFVEIIETILDKYPVLPEENNPELQYDTKTMVLLAFELSIGYSYWLEKMGYEVEDSLYNENSLCLNDNLSHLHTARDIMNGTYRYLQGSKKLTYQELKQMLKDYSEKKPCQKPEKPSIPREYEEMRVRLFEQIHARNVAKVDEMVIEILESFLKKYPEIPDFDDPRAQNDIRMLGAIFYPFNLAYVGWLDENGIKEKDQNRNHDWESSSCLTDNVSNDRAVSLLVHDIKNYMRGGNTFSYGELMQKLQAYSKHG